MLNVAKGLKIQVIILLSCNLSIDTKTLKLNGGRDQYILNIVLYTIITFYLNCSAIRHLLSVRAHSGDTFHP